MAMEQVNYCNHSRQAIMFQYIMLNGDKYPTFDKLYSDMLTDIKKSGNGALIQSIPDRKLLREANEIYDQEESSS